MPKTVIVEKGGKGMRGQRRRRRRGAGEVQRRTPLYIGGTHIFKFTVPSGGVTNQPVTGYDLLGLQGVAISSTGVNSMFASVRMLRARVRCQSALTNTPVVNWTWYGQQDSAQGYYDIAMGAKDNADTGWLVPPAHSSASFWVDYSLRANTFALVTAPVTSEVELEVEYVNLNAAVNGTTIAFVSSGLTVGGQYFGPLDHQTGSPKIIPSLVSYYG